MRTTYQEEWHRIPFRSFATLSSTRQADSAFYAKFYKAFFQRYSSPAELEPQWLRVKDQAVEFLLGRAEMNRESRILSLGCGLGYIEGKLLDAGYRHIEVNEVSRDPLRWILPRLTDDRVHVGFFPACVPPGQTYDVILLAGLEGVFDQASLVLLLKSVRERLRPGGACILLSWSHHVGRSPVAAVSDALKDAVKSVLDVAGVRPRGQLWSYLRSARELRLAMHAAGFTDLEEGLLQPTTPYPPYWIVARPR